MPNLPKIGQALWSADARPATAFALLAGLAVLVHRLLPTGSLPQNLVYDAIGVASVAAIIAGVVIYRPERPQPWLLLAAGQLLFVTGDALWTILELMGESPFPSIADVAYLLGYPLLVVAFLMAIQLRVRGGDRAGLLDGAILASACALVGWVVLVRPVLDSADDPISLIVTAAYPLGDLVILGVAIGLLSTPGARTTSLRPPDRLDRHAVRRRHRVRVPGRVGDVRRRRRARQPVAVLVHRHGLGRAPSLDARRRRAAPGRRRVAGQDPPVAARPGDAHRAGARAYRQRAVGVRRPDARHRVGAAVAARPVAARIGRPGARPRQRGPGQARGRAQLPGLARPAHGAAQPAPVRRAARRRARTREPAAARRPVRRPRRLQDRQRQPRPRRGRCAARLPWPAGSRTCCARRHARRGSVATSSAILLEDGEDADGAERVADRLLDALDEPFEIDGAGPLLARQHRHRRRVRRRRDAPTTLLRDADIAMYHGEGGRHGPRTSLRARDARSRVRTGSSSSRDLRQALDARASSSVAYQPIVELDDGPRSSGVEALVRWQHPTRGLLRRRVHPARRGDRAHRRRSAAGCCARRAARSRGWRAELAPTARPVSVNLSAPPARRPGPRRDDRRASCASTGLPPTR